MLFLRGFYIHPKQRILHNLVLLCTAPVSGPQCLVGLSRSVCPHSTTFPVSCPQWCWAFSRGLIVALWPVLWQTPQCHTGRELGSAPLIEENDSQSSPMTKCNLGYRRSRGCEEDRLLQIKSKPNLLFLCV